MAVIAVLTVLTFWFQTGNIHLIKQTTDQYAINKETGGDLKWHPDGDIKPPKDKG